MLDGIDDVSITQDHGVVRIATTTLELVITRIQNPEVGTTGAFEVCAFWAAVAHDPGVL